MLRELARRLVALPFILLAVTLSAFAALSSTSAQVGPPLVDPSLRRALQSLPRFVNTSPSDVRSQTLDAVHALEHRDDDTAAASLEQLGGAALPIVLPMLDGLSPEPRARVALALRPVAIRMGIHDIASTNDGASAASSWIAFWEDRALDFKPAAIRRTIDRYAENPTPVRLADVTLLDTLALHPIFEFHLGAEGALPSETTAARLLPVVHHALGTNASTDARRDVIQMRQRWFAERSRYRVLDGGERALATLLETQYARWLSALVAVNLGFAPAQRSEAFTLVVRGCWTVSLLILGLVIAWALSLTSAAFVASRRSAALDHTMLVAFVVLTALGGVALPHLASTASSFALACVILGLVLALPLERRARRAIRDELALAHITAARARGASWTSVILRHALPRGIEALATSLPYDVALATSMVFVLEAMQGARGLGQFVSRSVRDGDGPGMLGLALLGALWTSVAQTISIMIRWALDGRGASNAGAR